MSAPPQVPGNLLGAIDGRRGNQQLSYLEAMTPPTWPENILLLSVRHRPGSKV